MSRRVRGEEGRERKGSGSGWDGRAVECRKETAPGLWHGSGAAEKGHPDCAKEVRVICCKERHLACVMNLRGAAEKGHLACAKAAGGGAKTKTKTGFRSLLKPVPILYSSMITALKLQR